MLYLLYQPDLIWIKHIYNNFLKQWRKKYKNPSLNEVSDTVGPCHTFADIHCLHVLSMSHIFYFSFQTAYNAIYIADICRVHQQSLPIAAKVGVLVHAMEPLSWTILSRWSYVWGGLSGGIRYSWFTRAWQHIEKNYCSVGNLTSEFMLLFFNLENVIKIYPQFLVAWGIWAHGIVKPCL